MADNLFFYNRLTDQLIKDAGIKAGSYTYSYFFQDNEVLLSSKGKNTVRLSDEENNDLWSLEDDGLSIKRIITIEYPDLLYGNGGIAPREAEIGICIYWTNNTHSTSGCILPKGEWGTERRSFLFEYHFEPHFIKGDLKLDLGFYLKKRATRVNYDETNLANEEGLNLGIIDSIVIDFGNAYMEFPIVTVDDKSQPLWWVEIHPWNDPRIDMMTVDNVCLYLNSAYKSCPAAGNEMENIDILIEILSQVYFLIFKEIDNNWNLQATLDGSDELAPNSICKIMNLFYDSCKEVEPLDFKSNDRLLRSININVRHILTEEDDEE